jgi:hypothetical protein
MGRKRGSSLQLRDNNAKSYLCGYEKWVNHVFTHIPYWKVPARCIAPNYEVSQNCVSQVANTRAYHHPPPPRHLLAMSHVIDDNVVPENRGGRRKFGETEDIAPLNEVVANDALVCQRGKVTENFEEVARALNEGNVLSWNSNGKHCNRRYKLLLVSFRRASERAH